MNETTTGHAWGDSRCVNCDIEKPRPWAEPCPNVKSAGGVVLRVGGFYSRCGACGKNADPYEKAHDMKVMKGEGCGATFTRIVSDTYYPADMGTDDRLREMRPDLATQPATSEGDHA